MAPTWRLDNSLRWEVLLRIGSHGTPFLTDHVKREHTCHLTHTPPSDKKTMMIAVSQVLPQALPRRAGSQPVKQTGPGMDARGLQGCRAGPAEHRHETVFFFLFFFISFLFVRDCARSCRILCRSLLFPITTSLTGPVASIRIIIPQATHQLQQTPCRPESYVDDVSMQLAHHPFGETCPGGREAGAWGVSYIINAVLGNVHMYTQQVVQYMKMPAPPTPAHT